jgi:hypothetical protein
MVEVFKTNVTDRSKAIRLVAEIQKKFRRYRATFDLDDCDHILRIQSSGKNIEPAPLLALLKKMKVEAEVLPDSPAEALEVDDYSLTPFSQRSLLMAKRID